MNTRRKTLYSFWNLLSSIFSHILIVWRANNDEQPRWMWRSRKRTEEEKLNQWESKWNRFRVGKEEKSMNIAHLIRFIRLWSAVLLKHFLSLCSISAMRKRLRYVTMLDICGILQRFFLFFVRQSIHVVPARPALMLWYARVRSSAPTHNRRKPDFSKFRHKWKLTNIIDSREEYLCEQPVLMSWTKYKW